MVSKFVNVTIYPQDNNNILKKQEKILKKERIKISWVGIDTRAIPATWEAELESIEVKSQAWKIVLRTKQAGGVTQVLLCKYEALGSNPSLTHTEKKVIL
jgi:hypothetical protein